MNNIEIKIMPERNYLQLENLSVVLTHKCVVFRIGLTLTLIKKQIQIKLKNIFKKHKKS